MNDAVLQAIRTRRVVRAFTQDPVGRDQLEAVLDCARHAPHAGNRRLHRYAAVTSPPLLRALRMVSPGMLQRPMAAIVVCVDWPQVHAYGISPGNPGPYIDVGTACATLLLAAHGAGLGAGPVTSFSRTAVATILGLPQGVAPELIVCLGHPAAEQPPAMRRRGGPAWQDVVQWERG
ncbi:nitroreductase [Streptomyces viridiviolaceus]|uniref:Nitroreductase family protein n=1 Tax=Streptomyces viridiviolaceus TaxID=68282 RepID=A0ABW2E375_9ACTN|nr:nitroreductase family protein [Streptomyces viridiviolaceus]GHB54232.1 nitroreductase [Streptomyces viridiviolaceus]